MSRFNRVLFAFLYLVSSAIFIYHLAYAANWSLKWWPNGKVRQVFVAAHAKNLLNPFLDTYERERIELIKQFYPNIEEQIFNRLIISFVLAAVVSSAPFMLPRYRRRTERKFLRGAQLIDAGRLARLARKRLHRSPITIGGVPIPTDNECLHIAVEGTTGTGKSQAIYLMVHQARERGDRGVIFDVGGAYLSRFFSPGSQDQILSIGDSRSMKWNPFTEINNSFDFANIARAAIPDGTGESASWHEKGRVLFSNVFRSLYQSGEHQVSRLVHLIMVAEPSELAPIVAGTPAAIFCQKGNEKILQNTRAIISTYLQPWAMLSDGGDFSLKEWVRTGQNWLFISYRDNQLAALRGLLAAWLGMLISESLSIEEEFATRTWLIVDEFDTLGKVEGAKEALTKLRKYKTSCVFGFQTISQPQATYGREVAQTILSCLSNKLYLRAGDPQTAKWCADDLGQQQFKRTEQSENRKKGIYLADQSETDAERHVTEHVVMPAELQNLPNLVAYLSLAGSYPVAQVKIGISNLPRVAKPFD